MRLVICSNLPEPGEADADGELREGFDHSPVRDRLNASQLDMSQLDMSALGLLSSLGLDDRSDTCSNASEQSEKEEAEVDELHEQVDSNDDDDSDAGGFDLAALGQQIRRDRVESESQSKSWQDRESPVVPFGDGNGESDVLVPFPDTAPIGGTKS